MANAREEISPASKRPLEPSERISEVLFGLIMVLSFTCSFSVAEAGRAQVRHMLVAALGCNFAWGIIDGVFYLMACLSERGHNTVLFRAIRKASDGATARRILRGGLPPMIAEVMSDSEVDAVLQKLLRLPELPMRARLAKEEWLGSVGVFLLVFVSTFPVVIPFVLLSNVRLALRLSNLVAIVLLVIAGYKFAQYSGYRPWRVGALMVVVGVLLVVLTIVFGG